MNANLHANVAQAALWNGVAGQAWVESQRVLDELFKPMENLLADAVGAASALRVLDVGCGTGSMTLAMAQRLSANARCTGIDISAPMIALARHRAEAEGSAAEFILADAQTHDFGAARFDMIVSRFGVMFFDDPVRAFTNLQHIASPGCTLRMIAWRSAAENPFMTTAERAAATQLPDLAVSPPGAPGQFAFADRDRVHHILDQSGWANMDIRPVDLVCTMAEKDLIGYLTRLGPVGRVLQQQDEQARCRIIDTVRRAFDPFVFGDRVSFTAACWMLCADKPV